MSGQQNVGTGSIWNVNNWHWENKNYTEVAKTLVTAKFDDFKFERDGIRFAVVKVTKVTGEAQINIRKGKQIIIYELEVEADWRGETDADECEGNFRLVDVNESDLDFEVAAVNVTKENKIGGKAKAVLRKCLKDALIPLFKPFTAELMALENDKQKLEEDKKKREDNDAKYKQIVAEKGHEKEQMLEAQRLADEEKKRKNAQNN